MTDYYNQIFHGQSIFDICKKIHDDDYAREKLNELHKEYETTQNVNLDPYYPLLVANDDIATQTWELISDKSTCDYGKIFHLIRDMIINIGPHTNIILRMMRDTRGYIHVPQHHIHHAPEDTPMEVLLDIYKTSYTQCVIPDDIKYFLRESRSFEFTRKFIPIFFSYYSLENKIQFHHIIEAQNEDVFKFLLCYYRLKIKDVSIENAKVDGRLESTVYIEIIRSILDENPANADWMIPYFITENWPKSFRTSALFAVLDPTVTSFRLIRHLYKMGFNINARTRVTTFPRRTIAELKEPGFEYFFEEVQKCGFDSDEIVDGYFRYSLIEYAALTDNKYAFKYFLRNGSRRGPVIEIPLSYRGDLEKLLDCVEKTFEDIYKNITTTLSPIIHKTAIHHVSMCVQHTKKKKKKHNLSLPENLMQLILFASFDKANLFIKKDRTRYLIRRGINKK